MKRVAPFEVWNAVLEALRRGYFTIVLRTLEMCQRSTRGISALWSGEMEEVSTAQVVCRLRDAPVEVVQR